MKKETLPPFMTDLQKAAKEGEENAKRNIILNAEVKTFKQTITDEETGVIVKNLYYLRIVRGNVTTQINVGEKTFNQVKTLTEEKI